MTGTMPKPTPPAENEPTRAGVQLNAVVDQEIRDQLTAYMKAHNASDEHRATIRSCLEAALKMYLKDKGFWPPTPPKGK